MTNYLDPLNFAEGPVFLMLGKSALDVSPDVLPADNVPFIVAGGDWGGSWRIVGFTTEEGIQHGGLGAATTPQNTAQQRGAASIIRGVSTQTVECNLLELSAQNMKAALGSGTIVTTATSEDLELTDDQTEYVAVGVEAFGPRGKPLRIIYPIAVASITGNVGNRIGANSSIPARWTRAGFAEGNPHWHFIIA